MSEYEVKLPTKNTMTSDEIVQEYYYDSDIESVPVKTGFDFSFENKQWLSKEFVEKCIDEEMCSRCKENPCDWCKMMITLKQKLEARNENITSTR